MTSSWVASIFLYNSELWSLTKANTRKIDIFQRGLLRQIIRIKHCTTSILVWPHDHTSSWCPTVPAYRETIRPYKKTQGGQKIIWISTIRRDFKELNIESIDVERIAHNRDAYNQLIGSAMASGSHASTAQAQWILNSEVRPGERVLTTTKTTMCHQRRQSWNHLNSRFPVLDFTRS